MCVSKFETDVFYVTIVLYYLFIYFINLLNFEFTSYVKKNYIKIIIKDIADKDIYFKNELGSFVLTFTQILQKKPGLLMQITISQAVLMGKKLSYLLVLFIS